MQLISIFKGGFQSHGFYEDPPKRKSKIYLKYLKPELSINIKLVPINQLRSFEIN